LLVVAIIKFAVFFTDLDSLSVEWIAVIAVAAVMTIIGLALLGLLLFVW